MGLLSDLDLLKDLDSLEDLDSQGKLGDPAAAAAAAAGKVMVGSASRVTWMEGSASQLASLLGV